MIYLAALVGGLLAGAALGFGWGMLAASAYTNMAGARDGGPAMAGFFYIGPFGLISGFLMTFGFILRWNQGDSIASKATLWGGAGVMALGLVVFLLPWINANRATPAAKYTLTMEFELPSTTAADTLKWGYLGHNAEASANYPFYTQRTEGDRIVYSGQMQMSDVPPKRFALFAQSGKDQKFEVPVSGTVQQPYDWSAWQTGDGVRFRWSIR